MNKKETSLDQLGGSFFKFIIFAELVGFSIAIFSSFGIKTFNWWYGGISLACIIAVFIIPIVRNITMILLTFYWPYLTATSFEDGAGIGKILVISGVVFLLSAGVHFSIVNVPKSDKNNKDTIESKEEGEPI